LPRFRKNQEAGELKIGLAVKNKNLCDRVMHLPVPAQPVLREVSYLY
jgi:hypothetical protein